MVSLDPTLAIDLGQLGILGGIFHRLGSLRSSMKDVRRRVKTLEGRVL